MKKSFEYLYENTKSDVISLPVETTVQKLPLNELSWQNFEKLCLRLVEIDYKQSDCDIYGVEGQAQFGIDIFARKDDLKYASYQCKRYQYITGNDLQKAITKFKGGQWFNRCSDFTFCTTFPLNATQLQDKYLELKQELESEGVNFKLWDKINIERILKKQPDIVIDFFGYEWTKVFNGKEKADAVVKKYRTSTFSITKHTLEDKYRKTYIGDIFINNELIFREYNKEKSKLEIGYLFEENNKDVSMSQLTSKRSKVIILGNPGLGKTTELEQLAVEIWEDKNNEYVPIYKNLKNFSTTDTVESYLIVDFKQIDKVIYIFDGIDEISDIQDFTSKLQLFIAKLEANNRKSKFVLSCRTNVYDSSAKNIPDFTTYFLRELTDFEGVKLLNTLSGKQISLGDIDPNFNTFLRNPFQINIAAEYIKSKGRVPSNTSDLWAIYIDKRLNVDESGKLIKKNIDTTLIKYYSKKLSLINELIKTNVFIKDDLYKVVDLNNNNFEKFITNPLIEKQQGTNEWSFEHRNIQEYFAALALSELEFDEIIKFIEIEGTGKTHPLLFNTISFLINLVDNIDDKFKLLIEWIIENEPELLFNTDTDRINNEIKEKVFKIYFKREVIEKTYWINTNGIYSVEKIARFADSPENFDYLFKIVNNTENQFRVQASAIELLSYFEIPFIKQEELKNLVLENLESPKIIPLIKNRFLELVKKQGSLRNDNTLLKFIFEIFKNETDKEINSGLLTLLYEVEDINPYSNYIKEEFLRAYKVKSRLEKDEVHRGNSMNAFQLFLKLESEAIFKEIAILIFDNKISDFRIDQYFVKFIDRCIYFVNQNNELIISILDRLEDFSYHKYEKELLLIINETKIKDIIVKYLLEEKEFSSARYFLARLVDNDNIEDLAAKVYTNEKDAQEIEFFRNVIGNTNNRDLAEKFHNLMKEKGIKFKEEIFTNKKQKAEEEEFKKRVQYHFNLLFDKPKLLEEINKIFLNNGEELDWNDIMEIERKWYEKNGHWNTLIDTPLQLIRRSLYQRNSKINFGIIKSILEADYVIIFEIKKVIENYKDRDFKYKLNDYHKGFIKRWCLNTAEDFDCGNIVIINEDDSFRYNQENYNILNTILYFSEELNFSLSKVFLLNCMKVYMFNSDSETDKDFEEYKKKINDEESFNKQIVDNLVNSKMSPASTTRHIAYALEYKLESAYSNIREYLKADYKLNIKVCDNLERYIKLTNDYDFLLEFNSKPEEFYFWCGITLLVDAKKHIEYCKEVALKYLESDQESYQRKAMGVLFLQNDIQAINKIIESYKKNKYLQISETDISNFNAIEDFLVIKKLYDIAYDNITDRFNSYEYIMFLRKYLYNISVNKESYNKVRKILEEIRLKLKSENVDLFHINWLIDDVSKSYINSLSKSYNFRRAHKIIKELGL